MTSFPTLTEVFEQTLAAACEHTGADPAAVMNPYRRGGKTSEARRKIINHLFSFGLPIKAIARLMQLNVDTVYYHRSHFRRRANARYLERKCAQAEASA